MFVACVHACVQCSLGLKSFSRQVWLKVMEKKETDYNEVAEEMLQDLKAEEAAQGGPPPYYGYPGAQGGGGGDSSLSAAAAVLDRSQFDERNVRR